MQDGIHVVYYLLIYIQFFDGATGTYIGTACGNRLRTVNGLSNSMVLLFVTDFNAKRKGFNFIWSGKLIRFIKCCLMPQ